MLQASPCGQCGYMTSATICKACQLLDGLNKGRAKYTLCADRVQKRIKSDEMSDRQTHRPAKTSGSLEW